MRRLENGKYAVHPEAVEGMSNRRPATRSIFTTEDLQHLEDAIMDSMGDTGATAMPGAEHVYAKIYREIYGRLPPEHD